MARGHHAREGLARRASAMAVVMVVMMMVMRVAMVVTRGASVCGHREHRQHGGDGHDPGKRHGASSCGVNIRTSCPGPASCLK